MQTWTWVIEHFDNHNGLQFLIEEIKNQGLPLKVIDWTKGEVKIPNHLNNVIFFGSQDTGELFKGQGLTFLGGDEFLYSNWINSSLCLNKGEILKLSYVESNKAVLFQSHSNGFFIRPNSWKKLFSGQVITPENFDSKMENIKFYLENDVDVLVSPLQSIKKEIRILCIDNEIVTASSYFPNVISSQREELVDDYLEIFNQIKISGTLPSPYCTIDLAETADGLKLIEFNPLSTSAIYKSNPAVIVAALQKIIK